MGCCHSELLVLHSNARISLSEEDHGTNEDSLLRVERKASLQSNEAAPAELHM